MEEEKNSDAILEEIINQLKVYVATASVEDKEFSENSTINKAIRHAIAYSTFSIFIKLCEEFNLTKLQGKNMLADIYAKASIIPACNKMPLIVVKTAYKKELLDIITKYIDRWIEDYQDKNPQQELDEREQEFINKMTEMIKSVFPNASVSAEKIS